MGKRAKEIREVALQLQREERSGSKGRKWKKNVKKLQEVRIWCGFLSCEVYARGELDIQMKELVCRNLFFWRRMKLRWRKYTLKENR